MADEHGTALNSAVIKLKARRNLDDQADALLHVVDSAKLLRTVLEQIAADVHLVLEDYYSGLPEQRDAAAPAYGRLASLIEDDEEQVRDVDGILASFAAQEADRG